MTQHITLPSLVMPVSEAAEWSVLTSLLNEPQRIGEVVGFPLAQEDFSRPDTRTIYSTTVERYYGNHAIDPLSIGFAARGELAVHWEMEPDHVADALRQRTQLALQAPNVLDHVEIIKRLSTARQLQHACLSALGAIEDGSRTPEEIGDTLSTETLQIVSGGFKRSELLTWMETGRQYVNHLAQLIKARRDGQEIGVYTGLSFIDRYTAGIAPGELCILAGEPGVGKTGLAWAAGRGFAERQMARVVPPDQKKVATLFVSLEMSLYGSTMRIVQNLTEIDSIRLREGSLTRADYQRVLERWKQYETIPLYFNFASNFRLSQLRALIAEAIRRYNVGFVIIDHFRMIDADRRYENKNDEDEAKVRFLKEQLAQDLNVAVVCLAHTTKIGRGRDGQSPRPQLSDLRGSGQIAAHSDFVAFLFRPSKYMSREAKLEAMVDENEMEIIWEKNRFSISETGKFRFLPYSMRVEEIGDDLQQGLLTQGVN